MKRGKIFIISGPSGSGKTTLHDKLLENKAIRRKLGISVSATTRPRRKGEIEGLDYFFISKKMFEHKIRTNQFLEWEKVFDNYYGTPKKGVRDILAKGKNVLLCIDVKGAKTIYKEFPDSITIFIKTPTWEVLKTRLEARATDSKDVIKVRLKTAKEELKEASQYKYVIVNDRLVKATKELERIVLSELI